MYSESERIWFEEWPVDSVPTSYIHSSSNTVWIDGRVAMIVSDKINCTSLVQTTNYLKKQMTELLKDLVVTKYRKLEN